MFSLQGVQDQTAMASLLPGSRSPAWQRANVPVLSPFGGQRNAIQYGRVYISPPLAPGSVMEEISSRLEIHSLAPDVVPVTKAQIPTGPPTCDRVLRLNLPLEDNATNQHLVAKGGTLETGFTNAGFAIANGMKQLKDCTFSGKSSSSTALHTWLNELEMFLSTPSLECEQELFRHALGHPTEHYDNGYEGPFIAQPVLNSLRTDIVWNQPAYKDHCVQTGLLDSTLQQFKMTQAQHASVGAIILECDTRLLQLIWHLLKEEAKLSLTQAGVDSFYAAIVYLRWRYDRCTMHDTQMTLSKLNTIKSRATDDPKRTITLMQTMFMSLARTKEYPNLSETQKVAWIIAALMHIKPYAQLYHDLTRQDTDKLNAQGMFSQIRKFYSDHHDDFKSGATGRDDHAGATEHGANSINEYTEKERKNKRPFGQKAGNPKHKKGKTTPKLSQHIPKNPCHVCGETGHAAQNCPSPKKPKREVVCNICAGDHKAPVCPKRVIKDGRYSANRLALSDQSEEHCGECFRPGHLTKDCRTKPCPKCNSKRRHDHYRCDGTPHEANAMEFQSVDTDTDPEDGEFISCAMTELTEGTDACTWSDCVRNGSRFGPHDSHPTYTQISNQLKVSNQFTQLTIEDTSDQMHGLSAIQGYGSDEDRMSNQFTHLYESSDQNGLSAIQAYEPEPAIQIDESGEVQVTDQADIDLETHPVVWDDPLESDPMIDNNDMNTDDPPSELTSEHGTKHVTGTEAERDKWRNSRINRNLYESSDED